MIESAAILAGAFLVAIALTGWTRRIALHRGILDNPNERSSHSRPTPRGGGLAIVVSSLLAIAAFVARHQVDIALAAALFGGGLLIAMVGFYDDRRSLPAGFRIVAHVSAAVWAMYMLGGLPPMRIGEQVVSLGIWGNAAGTVAIVWVLNLFNFMDGIDGIAASEAVFVAGAGGVLAMVFAADFSAGLSALTIAATSFAFLCWNWPPAKIFMGDVGSGYLGYAIVVIALAAGRTSPVALLAWLLLGGVFFADATITLFARLMRGERIHLPHRDHAYQHLAARWRGHLPVTLLVCAVNLFGLLPLAVLSFVYQGAAASLTALILLCLAAIVWWIRATKFSAR
jgi:Fuc2NAc and GlcNAc transferase